MVRKHRGIDDFLFLGPSWVLITITNAPPESYYNKCPPGKQDNYSSRTKECRLIDLGKAHSCPCSAYHCYCCCCCSSSSLQEEKRFACFQRVFDVSSCLQGSERREASNNFTRSLQNDPTQISSNLLPIAWMEL